MDRTTATEWLERIVSTATPPALTAGDIDAALDASRVVDSAGLAPIDPGYVDTFNAHYAAALLFDLKATMAAGQDTGGLTAFTSEGSSFTRRQGTTAAGFAALADKHRALAFPGSGGVTVIHLDPDTTGPSPRSAWDVETVWDS